MKATFLGRVPLGEALLKQAEILKKTVLDADEATLLGFESDPVITLGLRADSADDVLCDGEELKRLGFSVSHVDRGGQATIHNPGQLVIFPVCPIRKIGVSRWIQSLAEITQRCLMEWAIDSHWDEKSPGLYTSHGKIMACGVRIRQGVSTHGIALNVNNRLSDFALIRACGKEKSRVDRMGGEVNLPSVFDMWIKKFHEAHC